MQKHRIPESELILNEDGSIYHLKLKPEHLASIIFTVGDPDRVPLVSQYFDKVDFNIHKREFVTHTGWKNGTKVTVMSTGMGTDNIEILMTELDALVNVDLDTRLVKENHTRLQIIRLGTSGSMQESVSLGTLLASETALGMDSLMVYYPELKGEQLMGEAIKNELGLSFQPYQANCSQKLLSKLGTEFVKGVTLTCPGFYAPQGREIRLKSRFDQFLERLSKIEVGGRKLTNFEMETAGYYAMGELLGHDVLSLNAIIANRPLETFDEKAEKTVDRLIRAALEVFVAKN